MIYVVLGMHKSGTTLISRILHESGVDMVESDNSHLSYEQGNQYERESTLSINQSLLKSWNLFSLDITPPDELEYDESICIRMQDVIEDCSSNYSDWGFKDPRTCLTYDMWATKLPEHKIIVVYRSPLEMWQRYRSKSVRKWYKFPFSAWKFSLRWCQYNSEILRLLSRKNIEFLVLNYTQLMMTRDEFTRLEEFVGRKLVDSRDLSLYHHRTDYGGALNWLKVSQILLRFRTNYSMEMIFRELEMCRKRGLSLLQ